MFRAVCRYEDGTQDDATVIITGEGGEIFQVAWEISNGERDRAVFELTRMRKPLGCGVPITVLSQPSPYLIV